MKLTDEEVRLLGDLELQIVGKQSYVFCDETGSGCWVFPQEAMDHFGFRVAQTLPLSRIMLATEWLRDQCQAELDRLTAETAQAPN